MTNVLKEFLVKIYSWDRIKTSVNRDQAIRDNWATIRSLSEQGTNESGLTTSARPPKAARAQGTEQVTRT